MIVRESLEFERGRSSAEIKRLFGGDFNPGDIILRPDNGASTFTTIMMFKKKLDPDYAGNEHYEVATLGYITPEGKTGYYGNRFELHQFNTGNHIDIDRKGTRYPDSKEVLILRKFFNQSKISKIKEKFGFYPVLNGKKLTLNEALDFERGSEPKKAVGVGFNAPRRFKTIEEFTDFIIAALPLIFGGKMPEDILSKQEDGMLPNTYYGEIANWLTERGFEMPNGVSDWEGRVEDSDPAFSFWTTPIVEKLEKILGQKRWVSYLS